MNPASDGGFIFHVKDERVVPIDWREYSRLTSLAFNLLPKWNVAAALLFLATDYGKIQNAKLEKLWDGLKPEDMPAHRQVFAMECISTTMELIENFCAMCYAYVGAIENSPRYFPLLLRDFGRVSQKRYPQGTLQFELGNVEGFLDGVVNSPDNLKKYLSCKSQPSTVVSQRNVGLLTLRTYWNDNKTWYNKFKHSNCVIPISAVFDVPGTYSALYKLPDEVSWKDPKVVLHDRLNPSTFGKRYSEALNDEVATLRTESLFGALESLDDAGTVLDQLNVFWQPIRAAQHRALFGEEIRAYRHAGEVSDNPSHTETRQES